MRYAEQPREPSVSGETCQKCGTEARITHGQCFRCKSWLGCTKCSAKATTEVFCKNCLAWASVYALLEHGPLPNRTLKKPLVLEQYPAAWRYCYLESEEKFQQELLALSPVTNDGHTAALVAFDAFKKGESLPYEKEFVAALQHQTPILSEGEGRLHRPREAQSEGPFSGIVAGSE